MTAFSENSFCFCTLALGKRYRALAARLAEDIAQFAPGIELIVFADRTKDFLKHTNIRVFPHRQTGIWACYNDKRFVLAKALELYPTAIMIDADTRMTQNIPHLTFRPGIDAANEDLISHVSKYRPERLARLRKIAQKLEINLEQARWVGESLFIVSRDNGKEKEFISWWDKIARYLELHGNEVDGYPIGLAAFKVGWAIHNENYRLLAQMKKHLDASDFPKKISWWESFCKRFGYHYRLNLARLVALKDFNFYYR